MSAADQRGLALLEDRVSELEGKVEMLTETLHRLLDVLEGDKQESPLDAAVRTFIERRSKRRGLVL